MRLAWAFLKKDLLIAISYRTSFIVQFLQIFVAVAFFYFASQPFNSQSWPDFLVRYGGNYFAFLIIGIAFVDYLALSLKTFCESLRESQLMGTLEILFLSPTPISKILIYSSIWGYTFTSIRFFLYLLFGIVFGLDLGRANPFAAFLVLILAIVCFASFGIIIASLTMLIKKAEFLNTMLNAAFVFLGGVIYPTAVLPSWLEKISAWLPFTYALDGMRLALISGCSLKEIFPQLFVLAIFSSVFFPVSLMAFKLAVRLAKKAGTVDNY